MNRVAPLLLVVGCAFLPAAAPARAGQAGESVSAGGVVLDLEIADARQVRLLRTEDGRFLYHVDYVDGASQRLTPEAFSRLLHQDRSTRPWWGALLNVSSWTGVAWVGIGFLGQLLFGARMFVQWVASERRKRSYVPVAFWWISLAAASMILIYFIWRRDPVGIVGQVTGWTIYLRNLWFIYRGRQVQGELTQETLGAAE